MRLKALGSKATKSFFVRDLVLAAELVNYRRERWLTPEGKVIVAPLPEGFSSGFSRNLRRACLALHAQGQVTMPRLTAILNSIGVEISKRQVVRLLTTDLEHSSRKTMRFCMPSLCRHPS
ncbi:hypothetical protein ACVMB3_007342 [Sinorhizobium meliloti]